MKRTVTLDPDVERLIRGAMRERAISFGEALNEAARIGLGGRKRATKFVQRSFRMGGAHEFRWDKALGVADAMEQGEFSRKLVAAGAKAPVVTGRPAARLKPCPDTGR
jgi:hypothetical protein